MTGHEAIDLTDTADLIRRIDELSARVDARWRHALATGDFDEVTRCTAASQALHKASVGLQTDLVTARPAQLETT